MIKRLVLVLDTSPLIVLLDELGMHEELRKLAQLITIIIPKPVITEYGKPIRIEGTQTAEATNQYPEKRGLGAGEQAMIDIAKTMAKSSTEAVVIAVSDDKRARRVCKEMGIECIGTLGLIELMKKKGIVTKDEAISIVRNIEETSLYVTKRLISDVITKIKKQDNINPLNRA